MKSATIARKSSSVVVLRDRNGNVEVLVLKRKEGQDFGNSYSFPGGKVELGDVEYLQKSGKDGKGVLNKVAGIRELYEETGLLVGRRKQDGWIKKYNSFKDFYQELNMDVVNELVRIITPQEFKSRYDNQFFVMKCDDLVNMGLYRKTGQIHDLHNVDQLVIDRNESDEYMWIGLNECLLKHREGSMKLSPPIVMIIQSLSKLKSAEAIQKYRNQLDPRLTSFPYIPVLVKSSEGVEFVMAGDSEFERDEVVKREIDGDLRKELFNQYKWFEQQQKGQNRFRFKDGCMVRVQIVGQKYQQLFDLAVEQVAKL